MARRLWLFLLSSVMSSPFVAFVACSAPAPVSQLTVRDDEGDSGTKKKDSGKKADEVPDGADPPLPDGGTPGRIYAHDKDTLDRYDPLANTRVEVGVFDCVPRNGAAGTKDNDSVIDLALDRTGQMYATTYWRLREVDATSGKSTPSGRHGAPSITELHVPVR